MDCESSGVLRAKGDHDDRFVLASSEPSRFIGSVKGRATLMESSNAPPFATAAAHAPGRAHAFFTAAVGHPPWPQRADARACDRVTT